MVSAHESARPADAEARGDGYTRDATGRIIFGPLGHPWAGPRYGERFPFNHRTVAEVEGR